MPKKQAGRTARARASRPPTRPSARPSAAVPVERAPMMPPSIGTPGVTGSPIAPTYTPRSASPTRAASRSYRAPKLGSLIPITDYNYVIADLRRIAMLAAAAFVILIGLTFLIH
ncbi:MAG: hypothetical protein ACRDIY_01105 [Chloroflexota bacterium]